MYILHFLFTFIVSNDIHFRFNQRRAPRAPSDGDNVQMKIPWRYPLHQYLIRIVMYYWLHKYYVRQQKEKV